MLGDPQDDLAHTKRKELIKTAIVIVLVLIAGMIILDYAIGDPMARG